MKFESLVRERPQICILEDMALQARRRHSDVQRYPRFNSLVDRFDPFRNRSLFGFPFPTTDEFRQLMDMPSSISTMKLNHIETPTSDLYKIDVPGVKGSDIRVTYDKGYVTVTAERKMEDSGDNYYESSYGKQSRTFPLHDDVDPSTLYSQLRDGVLTIAVDKRNEGRESGRDIPIDDQ